MGVLSAGIEVVGGATTKIEEGGRTTRPPNQDLADLPVADLFILLMGLRSETQQY